MNRDMLNPKRNPGKPRRPSAALLGVALGWAVLGESGVFGQDTNPFEASADLTVSSKYIWRGQRLTDDWVFQPSATFGVGGFSFNVWGNMDLTAVNEGDALFLAENPAAPPGGDHNGLQWHFSEIDYAFSYATQIESVSLDVGLLHYTFPDRSASLPATTELYGTVGLPDLPLSPSASLFVDVDESNEAGDTGLYALFSAGHSFPIQSAHFPSLDVSFSISLANGGFGNYYYGVDEAGFHDFNLGFSLPVQLGERVSAVAFLNYSALLGDFRQHQYLNPKKVYLGTAGTPAGSADTVWGGFTLSLAF